MIPESREGSALQGAAVSCRIAPTPRVLIVDDDPRLLVALSETLKRKLDGVGVEVSASPVKALASIAETDYDVVVSDLLMGGIDGLELLARVRAMRPNAMVVLMTGADDREISIRALRGGAYDFIQKPVDADYFAASVRRAIETRRLRAEVDRQQTELRLRAEELEQTVATRTDELRRLNQTKDEFLATLSHELRTPLTAILGWARLLCGGRLDSPMQTQAIESIARNAKSQAQLIDDMLDVSRIITGKLRLDVQRVDLFAALDAALGVVLPAAQAKGIDIEPILDEETGSIKGDPERLQQVLWNLLSNAIKFTPPGGRVVVRIARRDNSVEIEVKDDGPGIDPEFLPFIFDRFRQGDEQLSSRKGLGLGLAIVRHLVELHGGTVVASSAGKDKGATFKVTLPSGMRASEGAGRKGARLASIDRINAGPASQCLRSVRVLVVDDEPDTREVLRLMLEHSGATVYVASSVAEARDVFGRERPDALLCDIGLGSENGYALISELRALAPADGGDIPAIALTGYAKSEDRARALSAGFQLHLAKPGPADLATIVAGLLGGRGSA